MNDAVFFRNFNFHDYTFHGTHHRDNRSGVGWHFIGFMKHGKGLLLWEQGTMEIGENELFYIPKGCKYQSYWSGDPAVNFDSIGFKYFPTSDCGGYTLQKIPYDKEIWEAFTPLSQSKQVDTKSIGTLYTLLSKLQPILEKASVSKEAAIVDSVTVQMQKNPLGSISEHARFCGVGETAVYASFKKVLQKTPNRVRQEMLCRKAIDLLTTTDLSVEDVCTATGFSSASYFRKVLFSVTGKTPSQIRKNSGI